VTTFDEILAQAQLPETTVTLCLRGDLHAQWSELERQLPDASTEAVSLAEPSEAFRIAEQMEALREQMQAARVTFRLRAMSALDWAAFASTRPAPRKDDEDEVVWRGRWYAWVSELVSRCAVDPEMTTAQVGQLVSRISGTQWDELSNAAWAINERTVQIPFSAAASALTRTTAPE
jgi:hypothetical protein